MSMLMNPNELNILKEIVRGGYIPAYKGRMSIGGRIPAYKGKGVLLHRRRGDFHMNLQHQNSKGFGLHGYRPLTVGCGLRGMQRKRHLMHIHGGAFKFGDLFSKAKHGLTMAYEKISPYLIPIIKRTAKEAFESGLSSFSKGSTPKNILADIQRGGYESLKKQARGEGIRNKRKEKQEMLNRIRVLNNYNRKK